MKAKPVFLLLQGLLALFSPAMCPAAPAAEPQQVLRMSGMGAALGSVRMLGAAFATQHPGVVIKMLPSVGTSGAIRAVSKGAIDVGIGGRPMTGDERGLGLTAVAFAKTPIVFAVRKDNPVKNLRTRDVIRMIGGQELKWPSGARIRPVLRPASDTETLVIKAVSPEVGKAIDAVLLRGGALVAVTAQEAADLIEKTPGAFGISSLALIRSERRPLKPLAYNGVDPSPETVADGTYPFVATCYFVTRPAPSPLIRQFIEFARSTEGRRILEAAGNYVP
jgi:phosphate transport system substrate-binding protein